MITTWLIINCKGLDEHIHKAIMDTARPKFSPHVYSSTPWLEYQYDTDEPIPTIQISCESQKEAFRLRKELRVACEPYAERATVRAGRSKSSTQTREIVQNPLEGRVMLRYTDEHGDELEQPPARHSG